MHQPAPAKAVSIWLSLAILTKRPAALAGAASLLGVLAFGAALAMQHLMGLEPCPLCIFQRVAILSASLLGGMSWAVAAWRPGRASSALAAMGAVLALAGLGLASRHMYVMWVPQDVACGPDLEYLMDAFPPSKWLPKVFAGEAECAAAAKQLVLGLPIPVWAAAGFALQALALARAAWLGWEARRPVA